MSNFIPFIGQEFAYKIGSDKYKMKIIAVRGTTEFTAIDDTGRLCRIFTKRKTGVFEIKGRHGAGYADFDCAPETQLDPNF